MKRALPWLFAAGLAAATLPPLHVASNGAIVDDQGRPVLLRGINRSGTGSGNADAATTDADYAAANQMLSINVVRLFVNTNWWTNNVSVPMANMKYQDYIDALIQRAEKYGNYVMIVKAGQFPDAPCGADGKNCPAPNQGDLNCQATATRCPAEDTSGLYDDPAFAFWAAFAQRYASDPAVLYYTWEEMHAIDAPTWANTQNQVIAAIRDYSPQSLIFVGNGGTAFESIAGGQVADLAWPNLVWDAHIFAASNTTGCQQAASPYYANWPQTFNPIVNFAGQHGHGVSITEWGGCNDQDPYHTNIVSYAQDHSIALVYFDASNLFVRNAGGLALTANGTKAQQAYTALAASAQPVSSVSSASGGKTLAPEAIALAFGSNLTAATAPAKVLPLPFNLAGTSVSIKDAAGVERPAPLFFVSPKQVNYQVPAGTGAGTATITIAGSGGTAASGTVPIAAVAPGLYTANGSGQGVAYGFLVQAHPNGTVTSIPLYQCAAAGNCAAVPADFGAANDTAVLLLFGTGIRNRTALANVRCRVGSTALAVQYAGPQGDNVGLDQVNVALPQSMRGAGDVDVILTVDGAAANTVSVNLK